MHTSLFQMSGLLCLEVVAPPKEIKRTIFLKGNWRGHKNLEDDRSWCLLSLRILSKKASRNTYKSKRGGGKTFLFKSRILKALFLPLPTQVFQEVQSHSYLFNVAAAFVTWSTHSHARQQAPLSAILAQVSCLAQVSEKSQLFWYQ